MITLDQARWKRFFQVPCALVDNYIKLADGNALKLFLYIMSCDDMPDDGKIMSATGLDKDSLREAVMFWKDLGVMSDGDGSPAEVPASINIPEPKADTVTKVVHSRYQPKDIADKLKGSKDLKALFDEAESTLHRILNHPDHEALMSLKESYGFEDPSIILILAYCYDIGKTSARYYEKVAENLFEKGLTDFKEIDREFDRLKEQHSYENEIRSAVGAEAKLSPKQLQYALTWKDLGFNIDMIKLARDKCVDATNKLSFPYIDKIIHSWAEKGINTVEAAMNEQKPDRQTKKDRSFDLDEFDRFTLGGGDKK